MVIENVTLKTEFIKLDQLLKFANAAESGGMAKEMIQATLQYAHSTFSFQRIVAQILPNNTASIATAKSCHFRLEKRIKKQPF